MSLNSWLSSPSGLKGLSWFQVCFIAFVVLVAGLAVASFIF